MMRVHILLLFVYALTLGLAPAFSRAEVIHTIRAGEDKGGQGFEGLKDMGSFVVTSIADPLTFVLSDKRVVRLAGVELPVYPGESENPFAALAIQRMQAIFLGQKVTLYQTRDAKKGRTNSLGQQLGHIVRRDGDNKIWAQGVLVAEGLVRALPTISNPEGAAALFKEEEKVRNARKGLWGSAPWTVKDPDSVRPYIGTLQVVRGKVVSVATRNNLTYLNFGRDWKTDFTVTIDATMRRALMRAGINPLAMTGRMIEVRGYVEERNGPNIQLGAPQLIALLDGPKPVAQAEAKPFERKEKLEEQGDFVADPSLPVLPTQRAPVQREPLQ